METKSNTKIPLPNQLSRKETDDMDKVETPIATAKNPSKLRKPEVIVPESIKNMRRPSYGANEILQDQWDKEREYSRRLSANLISAQGLISQPDDLETELPHSLSRTTSHESRLEKIHDRLQCLVDVGNEEIDPIVEYRKESGPTEIMTAKGKQRGKTTVKKKIEF